VQGTAQLCVGWCLFGHFDIKWVEVRASAMCDEEGRARKSPGSELCSHEKTILSKLGKTADEAEAIQSDLEKYFDEQNIYEAGA